jgi:hypothetical protein
MMDALDIFALIVFVTGVTGFAISVTWNIIVLKKEVDQLQEIAITLLQDVGKLRKPRRTAINLPDPPLVSLL